MSDGKEKGNFVKYCCFNKHEKDNKGTPLGNYKILAPNVKKSVLELLGSTNCDMLDKMRKIHSYIFDMGAGQYFENYEDAEDALIKRNFPDISNDCQQSPVFLPETFLPKVPRAVYPTEQYEEQKKNYETYYRSARVQLSNKFLTNLKNFKLI